MLLNGEFRPKDFSHLQPWYYAAFRQHRACVFKHRNQQSLSVVALPQHCSLLICGIEAVMRRFSCCLPPLLLLTAFNVLFMLAPLLELQKWCTWRKRSVQISPQCKSSRFGISYSTLLCFAFKCLHLSVAMSLDWGKIFRGFVCLFKKKSASWSIPREAQSVLPDTSREWGCLSALPWSFPTV